MLKGLRHDDAERIFTKVHDNSIDNSELKKHELETMDLGRKIMDQLGPDRALFLDYEKLVYLKESYHIESAYKIGINDICCHDQCRPICRPKD